MQRQVGRGCLAGFKDLVLTEPNEKTLFWGQAKRPYYLKLPTAKKEPSVSRKPQSPSAHCGIDGFAIFLLAADHPPSHPHWREPAKSAASCCARAAQTEDLLTGCRKTASPARFVIHYDLTGSESQNGREWQFFCNLLGAVDV